MKKFIVFIWFYFALLSFVYSSDYCAAEPDEYVLKCTFHNDLFDRDLLCLNSDCTDKMYTYDTNIFLLEVGNVSSFVYKDTINLKAISDDVFILKQICKEKFTDSFLSFLRRSVTSSNPTYSGDKLLIEPFTNENYELALSNLNDYECYSESIDISGGWIVKSRTLKEYCFITDVGGCFLTEKSFKDSIYYQMKNSTDKFLRNIFSILLGIGIALGIFGFLIHIFENKKIDRFFKITQKKITISIIISIPLLYLSGLLVNIYLNEIYYILKEVFVVIGILLSYIITCIVNYYLEELKK